ncbi:MAG: hypothetical protein Q9160_006814 [Pyrenula sp. 1 TL-2023]
MVSIQYLPAVLLHRILAVLQAERKESFKRRDTINYLECTRALVNVAFVSKGLHSLAIIYAYKSVILTSDNLPYFIRTILSSVELRPLILDISLEFNSSSYANPDRSIMWDCEAPPRPMAGQAAKAFDFLKIPNKFRGDFRADRSESLVVPADQYDPILSEKLRLGRITHQAEASLILFLLPKLQSLRINTPEEETVAGASGAEEGLFRCHFFRGTLDLADPVSRGERSESLPIALQNLQEFTFCDPYQMPGSIKSAYPPVLFWPLDWLSSVFYLPRIRKLTLTRAAWDGDYSQSLNIRKRSSTLEDLVLQSARLHVDFVAELLRIPKGLRSFGLEIADAFSLKNEVEDSYFLPAYISPSKLISKLGSHKDTLESISVRSVQSNSVSTLDHACEMSGFNQSTIARALGEDDSVFLKHAHAILPPLSMTTFSRLCKASFHSTDLLGIPFDPSRRLSDLLPSSLTHLTLRYDPLVPEDQKSFFSEPFVHLFDLFADKDSGKVPSLKSVDMNLRKMWYMDFGVLDHLIKDAKEVGIELSREWHDDVLYDPAISGAKPLSVW